MIRTHWIVLSFFWASSVTGWMGGERIFVCAQQAQKPSHFILFLPENNASITKGPIVFQWQKNDDSRSRVSRVQRYEVTFWSKTEGFSETFTVFPNAEEDIAFLKFDDARKIFRRHGKYYWRVTAFDAEGNQTSSEVGNFRVGILKMQEELGIMNYPYAIQLQYVERMRTPEYKKFLDTIQPTTPMRSFFDLGLIFHQGWLLSVIDFQERFFVLSHIGVGCEVQSRIRLLKTLYFSFYPRGGVESAWLSTGLKNYTSTYSTARLGGDFVVMPRGFITLQTSWIPAYRARYSEKRGDLLTFGGEGWEFGIRCVIPKSILNTFRFLDMEVDFQRIPFEFNFGYVKDKYTATRMRIHRFTIGYLLW